MGMSPLKTSLCIDLHQIWHSGSREPHHPWHFFGNRLTGLDSMRGHILPFSYFQAIAINTVLVLPCSLWLCPHSPTYVKVVTCRVQCMFFILLFYAVHSRIRMYAGEDVSALTKENEELKIQVYCYRVCSENVFYD